MEIGPSRWSSIEGFYTQGAVEGIRLVCDALYGTLLRAYSRGVDAHIKRSLNVRGGEEIQRWEEAAGKARAAIVKADEASCIYDGGGENKKVRSQESARKALEHLQTRYLHTPILLKIPLLFLFLASIQLLIRVPPTSARSHLVSKRLRFASTSFSRASPGKWSPSLDVHPLPPLPRFRSI